MDVRLRFRACPPPGAAAAVRAAAAVLAAALAIPLAGCDDEPTAPGSAPIVVRGRIVERDLSPSAGARVQIAGQERDVDALGRFEFERVEPPYDVVVIPRYANTVWVYRGLRRPDPELLAYGGRPLSHYARVRGSLPPRSGFPSETIDIRFDGASVPAEATPTCGAGSGYSVWIEWSANLPVLTGELCVFSYREQSNLPIEYGGFARRRLVLEPDGEYLGVDFLARDFVPLPTATLRGRFLAPAGYSHEDRWVTLCIGRIRFNFIAQLGGGLEDTFEYTVPLLPQATFEVEERASEVVTAEFARTIQFGASEIGAGAGDLEFEAEPADALSTPAADATGVDSSTVFAWSPGGRGVHVLYIVPRLQWQPTYTIFLMEDSTNLPRIADPKLQLPAAASYGWQVGRVAPVASMDAVATHEFIGLYYGPDGARAYTEPREFTTRSPER